MLPHSSRFDLTVKREFKLDDSKSIFLRFSTFFVDLGLAQRTAVLGAVFIVCQMDVCYNQVLDPF